MKRFAYIAVLSTLLFASCNTYEREINEISVEIANIDAEIEQEELQWAHVMDGFEQEMEDAMSQYDSYEDVHEADIWIIDDIERRMQDFEVQTEVRIRELEIKQQQLEIKKLELEMRARR